MRNFCKQERCDRADVPGSTTSPSTAWLAAAGWHLTCLPTSQYCGDRDGRKNACVATHLNILSPPMHMQEKIEEKLLLSGGLVLRKLFPGQDNTQ